MQVNWQKLDAFKQLYELSDYAFAKKLGVSRSYLSTLRSGQRKPGTKFINAAIRLTGFKYEELFICPEHTHSGTVTGAPNAS